MYPRIGLLVPALCLAAACAKSSPEDPEGPWIDTDGDGLSDDEEATLGLDPEEVDSDRDGLVDGAETEIGTDPLVRDTDHDGYNDASELHAGTDPMDADSVIYQGGWPYNIRKDELENPTFAGSLGEIAVGERFPDLVGIDQFGELVHLYDFAGRRRPVVIDYSAQWCRPCMNLALYLLGANNSLPYDHVRQAVRNGEVSWITVMGQNLAYGLPTVTTSEEWSASFPDEQIPVLSPPNPAASMHYMDLQYFPTSIWLDEEMKVVAFQNAPNPWTALEALEAELSGR